MTSAENIRGKYLWLTIFAVAMGALEAIVVVYLRQLYYPDGFDFPIPVFPRQMIATEWFREFATILMLLGVGYIAGKNFLTRFAWFLYVFAVWDIFYYVWLKALLNWPSSLLTCDVLFLIPIPWISPVLAPVICSVTMILVAAAIIKIEKSGFKASIRWYEWIAVLTGAILILRTFIQDYSGIITREGGWGDFLNLTENKVFMMAVSRYHPQWYNWPLFITGETIIVITFILCFYRNIRKKRSEI